MSDAPGRIVPASIPRSSLAEGGPHFEELRAEGLRLVQGYAGQVWTDYNAHDPGVTTLEQICYALTDLHHRAGFPVADLLAGEGAGRPRLRPAWRALPCEPVTVADFRRLLLDRVPGLGNAWVTPRARDPDGLRQGLHDILLQPRLDPAGAGAALDGPGELRLRSAAEAAFLRHRPVCEDIGRLAVLKRLRVVVSARLTIRRGAEAERVVAEAVDALARALAPEPARQGLPPPGADASRILDGPLLHGGLVADSDLDRPRPSTVHVARLAALLADLPDVVGVERVALWAEGRGPVGPRGTFRVPGSRYCAIDAGLDGDASPFEVLIDGRPVRVEAGRVRRLLQHLTDARQTRHDLMPQYRTRFPGAEGRVRDLDSFGSVAESFPAVYALGGGGRPETPEAWQFRGYLAIFDAMMAGVLARLAAPRRVLARGRAAPSPVRDAMLAAIPSALRVAEGGELPDGAEGEEAMLDVLLVLAGEDPDGVVPPFDPAPAGRPGAKERLLRHARLLARRRGRGFDYRVAPTLRRLSGIEVRARVLLSAMTEDAPRLRIGVVEHNLLRPRTAERVRREAGRHRYPQSVSVVIVLPEEARHPVHRRAVLDMLRGEVPAHVGLLVHAVDRDGWGHFKRVDRAWRAALRSGAAEEIDWASVALRRALRALPSEEVTA